MAAMGSTSSFRHRFLPCFLKNLGAKTTPTMPMKWTFLRTFSSFPSIVGSRSHILKNRQLLQLTGLHTVAPVHYARGLPWLTACGRTQFSTLASRQKSGLLSLTSSWRSGSDYRSLISGGSHVNSADVKPQEIAPAWHGVRLSNENGYLSYNRNSYLCLVIGATMNVQTIVPHSAEAAIAFFVLGGLNVVFGTAGFLVNLKQLRANFGLTRLGYTTHVTWSLVHIVFYFLIMFTYLQTLEDGESLEDVGRSIQSRGLLDLDDDDDDVSDK